MTITDIFSALKILLDAAAWTAHTVTPKVWEYNIKNFTTNPEGIMVKKNKADSITAKDGTLIYELQRAEISGWCKTSKTTRNNLFEDTVDALETDGGYIIKDTSRYDAPREHNFRMNVEKIETR